jgi:ABC-type polysaccharide/polyol phosphate transport system ATPase subunit
MYLLVGGAPEAFLMPDSIVVNEVSKAFRIYSERNQALKQALLRRRRIRYEEFWALKNVSFSVREGSTFGIIGGNGAGKSTTLKLLSQILVPDRGSVQVKGRVSALLELGAGFHPELSGRENVFVNGAILGLSRRVLRERLDEIIDFAGIGAFVDSPVKTYSSGMYARLAFAVAVNVDPDILLLDEVLSVGDEVFQRKSAEKIAQLRAGGRTVVLVSHSLASVQQLCDTAAWIDHGAVMAIGKTADVVDAYITSVHPSGRVDEAGRFRSGTGEIRADCFVDAQESTSPVTGKPFTFRFELSAQVRMDDALLHYVVKRTDGVVVAGANTRTVLPALSIPAGPSTLILSVPNCPLLPADYEVSTSLVNASSQVVIDACERNCRFQVEPSADHAERDGIADLNGQWSFQ